MEKLVEDIWQFIEQRDWQKHQTMANIAKSITLEASELLENFQWSDDPADLANVKEEIADVLIYSLEMCYLLKENPEQLIRLKMAKNALKYPVKNLD